MLTSDIIARLKGAKQNGGGWMAQCPAHEDTNPSLSVTIGHDGRTLLHCHAGCSSESIVGALGLELRDLFADAGTDKRIIAEYDYVDEDGVVLFQVLRFAPKDFRQRRPDGKAGWIWNLNGTRRVLYHLPQLRAGINACKRVFCVEGEKDVHALEALGRVATTNPGGAQKWRPEYSDSLRGADVVIIADKDEPGFAHARQVARALEGIAAKVVTVTAIAGKDVSDHLAAGHTLAELEPLGDDDHHLRDDATVPRVSVVPAGLPEPDEPRIPTWPAPPEDVAFYGLLGELVRTVEPYSEADPVALLGHALVAFGNCINRSPYFSAEADKHHANEYVLMVGPTAKGRKGVALNHARSWFQEVDEDWTRGRIHKSLGSGEGLVWAVRDEILGVDDEGESIVQDPGVPDKRLLVVESEFAAVLKVIARQGSTLSPIVRDAWDSGHLQTMTKNSPARATDAHVSIIGHITADELRRELTMTDAANGFANRFLVLAVRRSKLLPDGGQVPDDLLRPLLHMLRVAVTTARTRTELRRDDEARDLWHHVYADLSEGRPGLVGSLTARAEAHVARLSLLYALSDGYALIKRVHLEAALALWRYAERSVAFIFGEKNGDPMVERLYGLLDPDRGMTRTEIYDALSRNVPRDKITEALTVLAGQARAECLRQPPTGPGRPAERWVRARDKRDKRDNSRDGADNALTRINAYTAPPSTEHSEAAP